MSQQLYILDNDNNAVPVTWGKYDEWEARLRSEERSALGKKIKTENVNGTAVVTYFMGTPIGFYGRKPQLWLTVAAGSDFYNERVYSSHRAAVSGHGHQVRELKKIVS